MESAPASRMGGWANERGETMTRKLSLALVLFSVFIMLGSVVLAEEGSSNTGAGSPKLIDSKKLLTGKSNFKEAYAEKIKNLKANVKMKIESKLESKGNSKFFVEVNGRVDDGLDGDLEEKIKVKIESRNSEKVLEFKSRREALAGKLEDRLEILSAKEDTCAWLVKRVRYAVDVAVKNSNTEAADALRAIAERLEGGACQFETEKGEVEGKIWAFRSEVLVDKAAGALDVVKRIEEKHTSVLTRLETLIETEVRTPEMETKMVSALGKLTRLNGIMDDKISDLESSLETFKGNPTKENAVVLRRDMSEARHWARIATKSVFRLVFMFNHYRNNPESFDAALIDAAAADIPDEADAQAQVTELVDAELELASADAAVAASAESTAVVESDDAGETDDSGMDSPSDLDDSDGSSDDSENGGDDE